MPSLLLILTLVAADAPEKSKKAGAAEPPKITRVADPTYVPQPGDRAFLDTQQRDEDGDPYDVPAAVSIEDLKTYVRLSLERDENGLDRLEDSKKVINFEPGTEVRVVQLAPVEMIRNPQGLGGIVGAAVEIVDGPYKGKTLYTNPRYVTQYVTVAAPAAPSAAKRKAARGASKKRPSVETKTPAEDTIPDPAARAASTLRLAQGLERAGKVRGALDLYRHLLKQFPKTPQAKIAQDRIRVLGAK